MLLLPIPTGGRRGTTREAKKSILLENACCYAPGAVLETLGQGQEGRPDDTGLVVGTS